MNELCVSGTQKAAEEHRTELGGREKKMFDADFLSFQLMLCKSDEKSGLDVKNERVWMVSGYKHTHKKTANSRFCHQLSRESVAGIGGLSKLFSNDGAERKKPQTDI